MFPWVSIPDSHPGMTDVGALGQVSPQILFLGLLTCPSCHLPIPGLNGCVFGARRGPPGNAQRTRTVKGAAGEAEGRWPIWGTQEARNPAISYCAIHTTNSPPVGWPRAPCPPEKAGPGRRREDQALVDGGSRTAGRQLRARGKPESQTLLCAQDSPEDRCFSELGRRWEPCPLSQCKAEAGHTGRPLAHLPREGKGSGRRRPL